MARLSIISYYLRVIVINSLDNQMKVQTMRNKIGRFFPALLMTSISIATVVSPARAGFLDGINDALRGVNNTVNSIQGTQQQTTGTLGNLTNLLGIGGQPANNGAPVDSTAQVLDIYAKWYMGVTPAEKEIVNLLTTSYAEDAPMTFAAFSKTPAYKDKDAQGKSQASAIFFKFSEVIKAIGPQKDKFLAYAFCVNGGGKNCK
jgi:hypothetical protein